LRPGRRSPFLLHWSDGTGKRRAAAYPSEAKREKAAKSLTEKRSDHGADVLKFDPNEWRRWLTFRELIGDADPVQVAQQWLAARDKHGVQASFSFPRHPSATSQPAPQKTGRFSHQSGDNARRNPYRRWGCGLVAADLRYATV